MEVFSIFRRPGELHLDPVKTLGKTILNPFFGREPIFLKERFGMLTGCYTKGLNFVVVQNFDQAGSHQILPKSLAMLIRRHYSPA